MTLKTKTVEVILSIMLLISAFTLGHHPLDDYLNRQIVQLATIELTRKI